MAWKSLNPILSIAFFTWLAPTIWAQLGPKDGLDLQPMDLNRVKVGDKAPDFTLEDNTGKKTSLSSFRGRRNVILVFYRGHW